MDILGQPATQRDTGSPLVLDASLRYQEEAAQYIAGGVNSNVRLGGVPFCFTAGQGSRLTDVDGNTYIDYSLGMGPTILGHAPPAVLSAVTESLSKGQLFAGQHSSELTLAKLLTAHIPSAERVRIGLTGSEMVQAALRLARAHTGRTGLVKFEGHYHGWFDNVLVNHTGPANEPTGPVPFPVHLQSDGQIDASVNETYVLPWNNLEAVERFLDAHGTEIAALITEPIMCNTGVILPEPGYLQGLRELCNHYGIVFVFDEVITGFRLGLGGAQAAFGIQPDLSVFAKAFGGGFPVAALVGRVELMDLFANGRVNHSGTYNANLVSIAAGVATLEALAEDDGVAFRSIEARGQQLMGGINQLADQYGMNLRTSGVGAVFHTCFSDTDNIVDYYTYKRTDGAQLVAFVEALIRHGVRPTNRGTWFVSAAHTADDIEQTLTAIDAVLSAGL